MSMQMQVELLALRDAIEVLGRRIAALETAEIFDDTPAKRGPGRPRKEPGHGQADRG